MTYELKEACSLSKCLNYDPQIVDLAGSVEPAASCYRVIFRGQMGEPDPQRLKGTVSRVARLQTAAMEAIRELRNIALSSAAGNTSEHKEGNAEESLRLIADLVANELTCVRQADGNFWG